MSVLIKGMEMPKNCWECRFNASTIDRSDVCVITNKTYNWGLPHPPSDCPITELPPHGDLISREWLIDIALHLMNTAKNDDIANGVKWLWQYIIDTPTILGAEEGE